MPHNRNCPRCGTELQGSGMSCPRCWGVPHIRYTTPLWQKASWPEETPPPPLPDDFTVPCPDAPGPIESRIADSYAKLIERAEKTAREVGRLQAVNAKLVEALESAVLYGDMSDAHYGPEGYYTSLPWYVQARAVLALVNEE